MALPPHAYFVVSAVFHYLGPAFAVLLFARVDVLGVAWLLPILALQVVDRERAVDGVRRLRALHAAHRPATT